MKEYSKRVVEEVEKIIQENSGNLVLIKETGKDGEGLIFKYSVTHKFRQSFFMFDDYDIVELLIEQLLAQNVEIFEDFAHLQRTYSKQVPKPMFWPEDRAWPPEKQ
ncbi:hypothetical protein [Paraflavitalea sp. CAU 1676]|uniref:hypothetical protein n=1 Tax=Paraflavitalea sp. CAU 1676 TaxID=3032598 RepID=UPI0023DC5383|nr:hypothetical protein [Paraflavitalea sp. CAU 1676]MDF2191609.1 hypothetical protein [Paraflavitalea sp. CAU 1676]